MTTTLEKVIQATNYIVHTKIPLEPTTTLKEIGADSLDLVEIVMELEEEYNIDIDDDNLSSFKTIQDIVNYIDNLNSKENTCQS